MKKIIALVLSLSLILIVSAGCDFRRPPAPNNATSDANNVDISKFIGEEKAKQIALEKAAIPSDGVMFKRVELERDNGIWQYEVDFRQGRVEYDADIKADDGSIISFEMDYDD